jgi:hypothetical protein
VTQAANPRVGDVGIACHSADREKQLTLASYEEEFARRVHLNVTPREVVAEASDKSETLGFSERRQLTKAVEVGPTKRA